MEGKIYITGLVMVVLMMMTSSESRHFWVGGKEGWVLKPTEGYSHWSHRTRFHVNDSLIFKFKEGTDSVLVVDKRAYDNCTKTNPIQNLTSAHSEFLFTQSGPFYFISGAADNCEKGQKLEVKVMAVKPKQPQVESPAPQPSHTHASWTVTPAPAPSAASMVVCGGGVVMGLGVGLFFLGF